MSDAANLGKRAKRVLNALREAFDSGEYPPGRRLPGERSLAERFGVSRPTIRCAVSQLVSEGRIRTRHGSGTVACEPDLPAGRSATVAVMSEFDGDLLRRFQRFLLVRGFMLCAFSVAARHFDPEVERLFLERVRAEKHRALIAICSPLQPVNTDLLAALAADGTRVIHIEPFRLSRPDQEYLLPDYEAAGLLAGERLRALKCTAIAYVRMDVAPFEMLLERGFRKAVPDADCFLCPPNISQDRPAREQVVAFLKRLPRRAGLFCRSLDIARGIHAIAQQHVAAKDLRILGVNMEGPVADSPVDLLTFDRLALLEEAMAHVVRPEPSVIRRMIAPTLALKTAETSHESRPTGPLFPRHARRNFDEF